MSSTNAPFGMRPVNHPSGQVRPVAGQIKSGYTADVFQNQPVRYGLSSDTGYEGYVVAAAAGDRLIGTFQGCEYTDTNGRRVVSNKWAANTVATDIVCYITTDPVITYEIQANAALAIDKIGQQYDISVGTGNATTGLSAAVLDVSSSANNAGLRVVGLSNAIDNAWADSYPLVYVQISEHQNIADRVSY